MTAAGLRIQVSIYLVMIELERTFLLKHFPAGLDKCRKDEIADIYYPKSAYHPVLRLRRHGRKYLLTRKTPVNEGDSSAQREQTIELAKSEFDTLSQLKGKELKKVRYYYDYNGRTAEIDIFKDALEGLVLADFEFSSDKEKQAFKMPEFCLAEVTNENFLAGGMLCGKKYEEISSKLAEFGYQKPL